MNKVAPKESRRQRHAAPSEALLRGFFISKGARKDDQR